MRRRLLKQPEIISQINITPLTDVALVLLIIFMVTTPLIMQAGVKVNLPATVTSEVQPETNLTITVTREGNVYFNEKQVTMESLRFYVEQGLMTNKERLIIINADKEVLHGQVVSVLDMVKLAGAKRIAIATEKKEENSK